MSCAQDRQARYTKHHISYGSIGRDSTKFPSLESLSTLTQLIKPLLTMCTNSNSHSWPWMHPHPTDQRHPLPPLFVDPFVMQHLLELQANNMPSHEGRIRHSYSSPFCIGPVYQGMAQQYRAPSSGPSRNQHSKGVRKTEAQCLYQLIHESSGTIARDHSTSTHPGHGQMGSTDNTGTGRAWTPPSRNPLMVDHNPTQQMRITHDKRHRHPRSRRKRRTDKVDPSMYEIPVVNLESKLISPSTLYQPF
jgi:hypothetical protein